MILTATLLIAIGVVLLLIELLLLPGFTLPGTAGIILILSGIGWAAWRTHSLVVGLTYAAVTAGVTFPLVLLGLWLMPRTRLGRQFILETSERGNEGFQAPPSDLQKLVGKGGRAVTPLRPAGTALIDGMRVDVVTEGEFIERGTEIEVVVVEGNRVVVAPQREEQGTNRGSPEVG